MAKKALYIMILVIAQTIILTNIVKATTVEITTETLNMREEPSIDSDIVALISVGDECEVLSDEGDWYEVKYGEHTGYISKEYTKVVGEETSAEETNTETDTETEESENSITEENVVDTPSEEQTNTIQNEIEDTETPEVNSVVTLNSDTNGRITPLINGRTIEKLKKGAEVAIINELNGWVYIQTDTTSCWIRKDKITTRTSNSSSKGDSQKEDEKTEGEKKDDNKETKLEKKTMYAKEEYVNIRKEPSTEAELVMTVERNTELDVIGETGDWYKVETSQGDAYISKELLSDKKVTVTNRGNVDRTKEKEEEAEVKKTSTSNSSNLGKNIVTYAKKFLGVPYVYGGASSSGFDCSGFTMYVFDHFGISMRHGAQAQSKLGTKVSVDKSSKSSMLNNLKVGDLVFFLDYETMDEIGHCGIYIGDGDFIHASSGSGYCVKINSLLPGEYYNTRYCSARRVI